MEHILRTTGYRVTNREELKQVAPAAFSNNHNRSKVYSFVPTTDILDKLEALGWKVTYAQQQGRSQFARHIIRLINDELGYMPLNNDKVRPQLILDNSHNGGSSAQLHPGLFRVSCGSDMVISVPNLFGSIRFRHMGLDIEELKEILAKMAEQYEIIGTHIAEMQKVILSPEQKVEFATRGMAYRDPRHINDDGTINLKSINETIRVDELLTPRHGGDEPLTLWDTFQTVREWLLKGGFEHKSAKGRVSRSKAIKNAIRQISINKLLWEMAEEFLNKPIEASLFDKLIHANNVKSNFRTYTTAKGQEKKVLVLESKDDRSKVKDVQSKLIFTVANDRLK